VNGFVGVEDAAEAVVQLLLSAINHERFIINAENVSFQQLLTWIAEGFGKKPPRREASRWMGSLAWRMEALKAAVTGSKALLTRETAKVAHSKTSFDNGKLLTALPGFHYQSLPMIIQNACKHYQSALQKGEITL
jgi:nucleoside-diphosphate-sugar epimerase